MKVVLLNSEIGDNVFRTVFRNPETVCEANHFDAEFKKDLERNGASCTYKEPFNHLATLEEVQVPIPYAHVSHEDMEAILEAMEVFGGSFVKSLVKSFQAADAANKRILYVAFYHYFDKYRRFKCQKDG